MIKSTAIALAVATASSARRQARRVSLTQRTDEDAFETE